MKVLLWGDALGAEMTVAAIGSSPLAGIVGAANLPRHWPLLAQLAHKVNVPFLVQPFRRNAEACGEFTNQLHNVAADVFLVNSFSMILPSHWLALPPRGTINLHAALLPQYRGANALNWVLVNGETKTGVTIHYVDSGIDTGDIILQEVLPIDFEDTALTLRTKISHLWPDMLNQVLEWIEKGNCPRRRQEEGKARYWQRRCPEDGRIDWEWPAERIYNLIRALVKPWPGAFFETAAGERVTFDSFLSLTQVRDLQTSYRKKPLRVSA